MCIVCLVFFFQAEDGIRHYKVTGVQTCALPICSRYRFRWSTSRPWALHHERRSEEHTSELQSPCNLVCRLLLEKKKKKKYHALKSDTQYHHSAYTLINARQLGSASSCRHTCAPAFLRRFHLVFFFFFFNDTATTEIYTLSLHDALPI